MNSGQLLVNYIGHGSEQTWGKTPFFENSDALALTNASTLPVVISMDCLNGFFQDVFEDTLAEALHEGPSNGAVAVWASSALTEPVAQGQMDRALYGQLLKNVGSPDRRRHAGREESDDRPGRSPHLDPVRRSHDVPRALSSLISGSKRPGFAPGLFCFFRLQMVRSRSTMSSR